MAGVHFTFTHEVTLSAADPRTLVQILAATNHRCLLHGIDVNPLGSTAGSTPLEFELLEQTNAGTGGSDDSANLQKRMPPEAYPESLQTTILTDIVSSEPSNTGKRLATLSVHQQSVLRWTPQDGPINIDGGTRIGFIYRDTQTPPIVLTFFLEE